MYLCKIETSCKMIVISAPCFFFLAGIEEAPRESTHSLHVRVHEFVGT